MFRRKDILLIVIVLLLAAGIYGIMMLTRSGQSLSGDVEIYVDGKLYQTARLDAPQEIVVTQANGEENTVTIEGGSVRMSHSSCKNQLCVQQGELTSDNWTRRSMGRTIVCLPNRVLIELALDEGHPSLEDQDIPDV